MLSQYAGTLALGGRLVCQGAAAMSTQLARRYGGVPEGSFLSDKQKQVCPPLNWGLAVVSDHGR